MSNKNDGQLINELVSQSKTFENNIINNLRSSKKIAWFVALTFFVYSICLTITISFVLPLKTIQPYVIRIDNNTGYTDVIPSLTDEQFTPDEALDRFWLAHYVELREKYVYETLQQDYERVQLYGSANVNKQYIGWFNSENAPYKMYGSNNTIEVKILSINLSVSDGEPPSKTAIIRAELTKIDHSNNNQYTTKRILITLSYDYKPRLELELQNRTINPLGFQILSYTVDIEK